MSDDVVNVLKDWQTLIAGLLALVAAGLTVWGTMLAANRQVRTAIETADKQIKAAEKATFKQVNAANLQVSAANAQTAVILRVEHKRILREQWAFAVAMEAAMIVVIEGAAHIREKFLAAHPVNLSNAYSARTGIRREIFPDLRSACLQQGGQLTEPFLRLDNAIGAYAAKVQTTLATSGAPQMVGTPEGIAEELEVIRIQAEALRDEAVSAKANYLAALS